MIARPQANKRTTSWEEPTWRGYKIHNVPIRDSGIAFFSLPSYQVLSSKSSQPRKKVRTPHWGGSKLWITLQGWYPGLVNVGFLLVASKKDLDREQAALYNLDNNRSCWQSKLLSFVLKVLARLQWSNEHGEVDLLKQSCKKGMISTICRWLPWRPTFPGISSATLLLFLTGRTKHIKHILKTSQELQMLSSVTLNCQVRMIVSIVRIVISFSNVKSPVLSFQLPKMRVKNEGEK